MIIFICNTRIEVIIMAKIMNNTVYFSVPEVEKVVNASKPTIISNIRKGHIPAHMVVYEKKGTATYYFMTEEAIELLKEKYGERHL